MINLERISIVATRLDRLGIEDTVFVGGAVVGLLLTDPGAPPARYTEDVDVIVRTETRAAYYQLEARLREAGYRQPPDGPVCRWIIDGVAVDLMPDDSRVLGFSNRWYADLVRHADDLRIEAGPHVKVASAVYMLATKIEAFRSRGSADFQRSTDIEDMLVIVDGRAEIVDEVLEAENRVRLFIQEALCDYLASSTFVEAIAGHLLPDATHQARATIIVERLERICRSIHGQDPS
jgi:predicted nucleotidyltransferase